MSFPDASQQIRLAVFRILAEHESSWSVTSLVRDVLEASTAIEHGLGETSDMAKALREANVRANLAERRLGHIRDALTDLGGGPLDTFAEAVEASLTWTPEDV